MKERWVITAKRADFHKIADDYGIDPVIARIMRNRDQITKEEMDLYLKGTLKDIPSPWLLKDMDIAVQLLADKIREKKKLRIIGDYDIDGVTATCILVNGLRRLGAEVDTYIPDRVEDGYGIHLHLIERALQDEVDTIITCDNGIAAEKEICFARENGLTVVVTDHHEVPYMEHEGKRIYRIPEANAIINPKQQECRYPDKNICGAVVAAKLVAALYERAGMGTDAWQEFLELMAIATVGDVMELQGENRILVREGLKKLPHTQNAGLRALIHVCELDDRPITSYHIGFVIGPCINASGRIATAAKSLALLNAETMEEAQRLAEQLKELNQVRQDMTEKGKADATAQVEEQLAEDRVLVVYLPDLHESIAGIVAGRLREQFQRPAFVLTRGKEYVKGSGRSVEAYSMYDELTKCKELFVQFGGHPMAAGITLEENNVETFRRKINELCSLTQDDLISKIQIDTPMPLSYVTEELIRGLQILEPYGKGNEKPLFLAQDLKVLRSTLLGRNQNVLRLDLQDAGGRRFSGICFRVTPERLDEIHRAERIHITYYPQINEYRGQTNIQFVIENFLTAG